MSLESYRDTFVSCLARLKGLTSASDTYLRFRWQAIYLTRDRFSYFFRGDLNVGKASFFGQQMDLISGATTAVPVSSIALYGATFGLNETIAVYNGPQKSVIDVAHAFNQESMRDYQAEFFYVGMSLVHVGDDGRMGFANPRLRENTNIIFVGLEDHTTADLIETSSLGRWIATDKPMASSEWYAERYYYH
ncbi:hypothetical protein [Rhizobium mesoamericanum]|uniref:Uncharacterized protein n=1 Tax=Rhizobium mesoamericanum STM3625 TaxID=1211777 RepID=K0PLY8_9HYPH|nr:hypothetical protein [Rhizobium mesoamericanum]CCM74958.1 hypothetical protein BN77_2110 [Rhizobium mesoamericanum STM3625]